SLDSAAHRFYWDTRESSHQKSVIACWAWCHLLVSLAAATVVVIFANEFSVKLVGSTAMAGSLRFAAGGLPLNVLGIIYQNRLRMQRRPWSVTQYALATSMITIILTAILVLGLHQGVQGVFMAQFAVSLGSTIFVA